ncbi:hypothetical protein [Streptomyces olivaceoviridis]|uniref:hypothetical protein n=1 Tax=Streptomyces olivaceoviridis TaxID=1921 RepID=UPI00369A9543
MLSSPAPYTETTGSKRAEALPGRTVLRRLPVTAYGDGRHGVHGGGLDFAAGQVWVVFVPAP